MTKTNEERYAERLDQFKRSFLEDYFDGLLGHMDVVEFLEEEEAYDEDFANDLFESINGALDVMVDRYLND